MQHSTSNPNDTQESQDVFTEPVPASVANSSGSRIHFPPSLDATTGRPSRQYPEYLQKSYGLNFAPPPRRGSPLNPQKSQRRVSVQANGSPIESPTIRHRRMPSPGIMDSGPVSPESEADIGLFSNEYDLSHEDPRILQDVQRAIQLKAKREARLKRQQQSPSIPFAESPISVTSPSQSPQPPWHARALSISNPASPTPPRKTSNSTASDIDFSPSTTPDLLQIPIYAHPVPTSLDNGRTLDWTGTGTDDDRDRKWPLTIGKKKEKDRILPLGVMAEQQELMYKEKLERLRGIASHQTHRKAIITKQQLDRRYKLIQESQTSPEYSQFSFAKVARWYSSVDDLVKRNMEKAEPFSWLRHLEGTKKKTKRLPWHMTALIMEEYVQAHKTKPIPHRPERNFSLETIPDESTPAVSSLGELSEPLSPTHETLSFGPQHHSHVDSLESRIRGTLDSTSSFRFPRFPLPSLETRGLARPYLQSNPRSDTSSAIDSLSDYSDNGPLKRPAAPPSTHQSPRSAPSIEMELPTVLEPLAIPVELKASTSSKDSTRSVQSKSPFPAVKPSKKAPLPRRIWNSIPGVDTPKRLVENDEIRLRHEYEVKLRILEDSNKQNHRTRQMLNRIAASVREYESVQAASCKKPGAFYEQLPKELLDSFSHDPAAVTGSTRRLRGWRAVEDIHQRVIRQREIFRNFLAIPPEQPTISGSILKKPAEDLMETLEDLEFHSQNITILTVEIAQSLQYVQTTHADVKNEYNSTVSRTSVVYPELSLIVALEESYRDRYQRFYDFGMDALTLFLDTVTPLWRTYGKTIGEDVRDFLIIPLYRNEFTGEAKRYPMKGLPCRSPYHWLSLILFFFASIGVNFLQLRTAVTSICHYRLQWIPYDGVRWTALPLFWIAIVIQWLAVIIELAIVLMQMGTIVWWIGWFIKIFH